MRCCKNTTDKPLPPRHPGCVRFVLIFLAAILCGMVRAEGIEILNSRIEAESERVYLLSAAAKIDFNPRLEDVVKTGIPLFFTLEFALERPRWYWSDQTVAKASQTVRLSYHALTRQYRLTTGSLHQTFPDLDSALRALARIHRWQVVDKRLKPGETLNASLRIRLDTSQLPRLFQVSASFTGSARNDWILDSGRHVWKYTAPDAIVAPSSVAPESDGEGEADMHDMSDTTEEGES
ncbi:MAG: DUF4390 domain-containing protein [Betaproteobacteria bacterium]|nr:DUF4390 domain-containing protein [Betaproteobacteria bacterium]